jgi:CDP-diacylglycerol--serine O-phosphatidyltransferase
MIKHVPNLFTLANLFCGCLATVFLFENNINVNAVTLIICLGIFFDLLDGFLARKLNVQSKLGLELDSLADLITSGLVPGIIIFRLFKNSSAVELSFISTELIAYLAFFITMASAYRLANFNIKDSPKNYFIGLPVPANTIMILSLLLVSELSTNSFVVELIINKYFLISLVIISSFLMNSNLKFICLIFTFNVGPVKWMQRFQRVFKCKI